MEDRDGNACELLRGLGAEEEVERSLKRVKALLERLERLRGGGPAKPPASGEARQQGTYALIERRWRGF